MKTLCEIARDCRTDKYQLGYTQIYTTYFDPIRTNNLNIFEIGICDGCSLKTWEEYFDNSQVYGIDLAEEGCMRISSSLINSLNRGRIHTFIADQGNRESLKLAMDHFGVEYDIILDDGHHFQSPQQVSLGFLFKYIKPGGMYIVEDIITPWDLAQGHDWGQRDKKGLTDCTANVLEGFIKNNKMDSPYMLDGEKTYLEENIESIKMFYPRRQGGELGPYGPEDPDSPITGASMICIIIKK